MRAFSLLVLTLLILLPAGAVSAGETLLIGIQCYNKGCRIKELEDVLTEAYARIGEQAEFRYLPPKRMGEEAMRNGIDGYGLITEAEARAVPGLVLVRQPLAKASLVAFSAYKGRKIAKWEDLRGLTVGTVRGSILLQDDTLDGLEVERYRFNDAKSAFSMLREGRLDVILGDATAGMLLARQMELEVFPSPPLMTANLYHAVAEAHAALAQPLADALGAMLRDGTMARLLGQYSGMAKDLPDAGN